MKSMKFYPRTYRYLENSFWRSALYFLGVFILPLIFGVIAHMHQITELFSRKACEVLGMLMQGRGFSISEATFLGHKTVAYLSITGEAKMPEHLEIQIVAAVIVFVFAVTGKRAGKPFFLFVAFEDLGFIINCLFFCFKAEDFPYTVNDFSELYIRQQIWIWIAFIVLYGIGTSCLGNKRYAFRLMHTVVFFFYSVMFAFVRYIVFMYVLSQYSMLYMFTMYFTFGPLIDCLNMVTSYGLVMNGIIKNLSKDESGEVWLWS